METPCRLAGWVARGDQAAIIVSHSKDRAGFDGLASTPGCIVRGFLDLFMSKVAGIETLVQKPSGGWAKDMELRDWFAGQALIGLAPTTDGATAARWAYGYADAMIAERNKTLRSST